MPDDYGSGAWKIGIFLNHTHYIIHGRLSRYHLRIWQVIQLKVTHNLTTSFIPHTGIASTVMNNGFMVMDMIMVLDGLFALAFLVMGTQSGYHPNIGYMCVDSMIRNQIIAMSMKRW
jgi:hypothetical protein